LTRYDRETGSLFVLVIFIAVLAYAVSSFVYSPSVAQSIFYLIVVLAIVALVVRVLDRR